MPARLFTAALVLLAASSARAASGSIVPTSNFIDTISGYASLSRCAEQVLSTIVRAQSSGCGDNRALTSYSCFCTDSSSLFNFEISSAVVRSCPSASASAQASSALSVFGAYCALGIEAGLTATEGASSTQTATGSAAPAASATGAAATQTASTLVTSTTSSASASAASAASSASDSSDSSKTTAIAAGVAVPVGVIGLALVGYLFYRKKLSARARHAPIAEPSQMSGPHASESAQTSEPSYKPYATHEAPMQNQIQELPGQTRNVHELDSTMRHEVEADPGKNER